MARARTARSAPVASEHAVPVARATEAEQQLRDGSTVAIRQVTPADRALLAAFFDRLSTESLGMRFLTSATSIGEEDLGYLTDLDHRRHDALVALDASSGNAVGEARYVRVPGDREAAEIAVVVADDWRNRGVATALLTRLSTLAREQGICRFTAFVSSDNRLVLEVLERVGGERLPGDGGAEVEFRIDVPEDGIGVRLRRALRAAAAGELGSLGALVRRVTTSGS